MTTDTQALSTARSHSVRPYGVWIVAGALAVAGLALAGVVSYQAASGSESDAQQTAVTSKSKAGTSSSKSNTAQATCANCGVIDSVQAVKLKGEGTGLGAVVGGVTGAAVGNQMGKGNGRTAMTVI